MLKGSNKITLKRHLNGIEYRLGVEFMQIFLLIVIFILIVINLKQADELRNLERKTLDDSQCCAAGGRRSITDE